MDRVHDLAAGGSAGALVAVVDFYGRVIEAGGKLNIPHQPTLHRAAALAKEPPKVLTPYEIGVVAERIGEIVN